MLNNRMINHCVAHDAELTTCEERLGYEVCDHSLQKDISIELLRKLDKLADYEGTGLTPNVCKNYKLFEDELISKGITFTELLGYVDKFVIARNKHCKDCKCYTEFEGVCWNSDSFHCADFIGEDGTCDKWDAKE